MFDGLDRQLQPAPGLDTRLKAVLLQHLYTFDSLAKRLRSLDRPEMYLSNTPQPKSALLQQQSAVPAPSGAPQICFTNAADEGYEQSQSEALALLPYSHTDQSFMDEHPDDVEQALEDAEGDSDLDDRGNAKVAPDSDAEEYNEIETLQILAWHSGRAAGRMSVRRELQHRKNDRGYGRAAPASPAPHHKLDTPLAPP